MIRPRPHECYYSSKIRKHALGSALNKNRKCVNNLVKWLKNFVKAQLQLSDKLGLNRNTLRKKIAENKDYL